MTDIEQIVSRLNDAQEPCEMCDGVGGFEAGGPQCCGGSQWECGASGCTGPIDGRYLEMCPACEGSGFHAHLMKDQTNDQS